MTVTNAVQTSKNIRTEVCKLTAQCLRTAELLSPGAVKVPVRLTEFRRIDGKSASAWSGTPAELAIHFVDTIAPTKSQLPLISGCTFGALRTSKRSLRSDANVKSISAIIGEHDDGQTSLREVEARLASHGVSAFGYCTPSSRPDAERWRIIASLSRDHAPDEHAGLVSHLDRLVGGDILTRECWSLSQSYFFGHVVGGPCNFVLLNGKPLDLIAPSTTEIRAHAPEGVCDRAADSDDWTNDVQVGPDFPPLSRQQIESALSFIPPDERHLWVRIGAALKAWHVRTGEDIDDLFVCWSRGDLRREGPRVPASFRGDADCLRLLATLRRDEVGP